MTTSVEHDFTLDRYQLEAIRHLDAGQSVLVAAPTGSGKTVVAEHAIERALSSGRRAFYTTPIKALSNQKFHDLTSLYGADRVGLLTGDNVINSAAEVVVMTTEVLRNMLYADATLDLLDVVVLDEVHYLEDTYRGPVWEEVILHLPSHVVLVCLSATVSNHDELGGWIESVRGDTAVVVETTRPVELTNLYAVGEERADRLHLLPTLVDGEANNEGHRFDLARGQRHGGNRKHRRALPWRPPHRLELLDELEERDLLPVIWFIFSRKGCDEAAASIVRAGARFTTDAEAGAIRSVISDRLDGLEPGDLDALGATAWAASLERGVAAHHAGLVPAFKEAVELCFADGLIRVVFATETLALGVNMPARSVVIDKLTKFNGDGHEQLTAGQFTQLTGRAGRRGIDDTGHAVVPWSPWTTFDQVAGLAGSTSFRLKSAFRPTYNMVANLLQRLDPSEARQLLARSFAQYQADAGVARLENKLARERQRVDDLAKRVGASDLGDREPTSNDDPTDQDVISEAVSRLRPGDVVTNDTGERLAVLGVSWRRGGRARIRLVDAGAHEVRWDLDELDFVPDTLGRIELPVPFTSQRHSFRNEVANQLRRARISTRTRSRRGRKHRSDLALQLQRARLEVRNLERKTANSESALARQFDSIASVLRDRQHLDKWQITDSGALIARIYHESDLFLAEALLGGLFDDLSESELASLASTFTYEHRSASPPPAPWFPSVTVYRRFRSFESLLGEVRSSERRHGASETRSPDGGFAAVAHAWAASEDLDALLDDELSAGDFVRNVKQLIDLLRQIGLVAPNPRTAATARRASDAVHRGVVALSGALAR